MMVEKIDRPEHRPVYEVRESKETKEDQHHQQNPREEMEKKYREELEGKGRDWDKFGAKSAIIKPVVVPRNRIGKLLFRSVILFKGTGILQADVVWVDGRKTQGALVRLARTEEYFQLKRIQVGGVVPESYWARGEQVELGIVQTGTASGPMPLKQKVPEKPKASGPAGFMKAIGLVGVDGKPNIGMAFVYALIVTLVTIAIVYEITRYR